MTRSLDVWTQDRDGDRVLMHVQTEVRNVVHGRSTSVCGSSRGPSARDPNHHVVTGRLIVTIQPDDLHALLRDYEPLGD
jgi:hypothetical protein